MTNGRTPEEQAYLDAWVDLANMPHPWERSAEQEVEAEAARQRLDDATQAFSVSVAYRWSPEVLAYNDFPAVAQRVAEREAQREAEGAASRDAWAALTPAEQEAELARQDAEHDLEADAREAEPELEAS